MLVASEDATSGSVIAKQERISPASSGASHCSFCAGVAASTKVSMLPVSGAEQLNGSAPIGERPMISHKGAYSSTESAFGSCFLGTNRFQRPADRAFAFKLVITGGSSQ